MQQAACRSFMWPAAAARPPLHSPSPSPPENATSDNKERAAGGALAWEKMYDPVYPQPATPVAMLDTATVTSSRLKSIFCARHRGAGELGDVMYQWKEAAHVQPPCHTPRAHAGRPLAPPCHCAADGKGEAGQHPLQGRAGQRALGVSCWMAAMSMADPKMTTSARPTIFTTCAPMAGK